MDINQHNDSDTSEIDLLDIFRTLLDNIVFIVCGALLLALVVYFFEAFLVTPQYTSSTTILVLAKEDNSRVDVNSLNVSSQLTNDYVQLITVRDVTEKAIRDLGLTDDDGNMMKHEALKDKLKVSRISDTRMITIEASDADPNIAHDIVEKVRDIAREHIKEVVNAEAVNVVEQANVPDAPSSPHKLRDAAIGGALGAVAVSAVVIIAHMMDNTIKSSDDVEKYLGITALGVIPIEDNTEVAFKSRKTKKGNRRGKGTAAG